MTTAALIIALAFQPTPVDASSPAGMSHSAIGVGHFFARSDWTPQASYLVFRAGPFIEGHAHQDQGSFDIWGAGAWLTNTENSRTRSGIKQGTEWNNLIRFERASGEVLQQKRSKAATCEVTDDGTTWTAIADMSQMYGVPLVWRRSVEYRRDKGTLRIQDYTELPEGVTAVWQMQTPVEPQKLGSRVMVAGKLLLLVDGPREPGVEIESWRVKDPANSPAGGWVSSVSGGSAFDILFEILP